MGIGHALAAEVVMLVATLDESHELAGVVQDVGFWEFLAVLWDALATQQHNWVRLEVDA